MILCRNGHENPDGTKVCAVCQVPIDVDPERDAEPTTPVESKPTPTPSQPRVSLAGASLSAKAGDKVETEIRVENPGGVDDSYQLQVLGEAGAWAALDPTDLSLAAGASGTVKLIFSPPASTTGVHPYEVRVASQQLPASPVSTVGLLEIVAPTETPKPPPEAKTLSAELQPQISKGRTVGEHDLTVRNDSDAAVTSQPSATEGQSDVALTFEPATITVAPGQSATTHVRVSPRRMLLLGQDRTHRFGIDAGQGVMVAGAMVQQPRVPKGVLLAAALAIIGAVIGIAVAVGSGGSTPKATIPNVAGQDFTQASGALQNNVTGCNPPCFNVVLAGTFSDTAPEGTTVGTNPQAGTVADRGSNVTLIVSRGKCPTPCFRGVIHLTAEQVAKLRLQLSP